jgi:hypothetical protein
VTLTQNFYIRRDSEERGSFRAKLDSNREVEAGGRFSTSRLIGSTGESETFGHHRFTMVAFTGEVSLRASPPHTDLRPVFIGWRMIAAGRRPREPDDGRQLWPQQIAQSPQAATSARPRLIGPRSERSAWRR